MRGFRRPNRAWSALTASALGMCVVAALSSAPVLGVSGAAATPAAPTGWVVAVPLCQPARPGRVTCFAIALRRATASTPGAVRTRPAASPSDQGPTGGLTPADLASAFRFDPTAGGSGQKVGIIDWGNDPTLAADLAAFDSHYGLAPCTEANHCLSVLNEDGKASPLPSDQGGAGEISLDVETVHSVCQRCTIDLVEASSNSFGDIDVAEDEAAELGDNEVSNSFGGPEGSSPPTAAEQSAFDHPGTVITASTGDAGYDNFDEYVDGTNSSSPNFPADLSTVVAVGGTSLYLNQSGGLQSETVWNDNGVGNWLETAVGEALGAGGGGCSRYITAPQWQLGLPDWSKAACGTKRLAADVATVADPYTGFDTYNTSDGGSGWGTVGGTSLASPLVAAMWALAGGAHGVRYPGLTLYGHLGSSALFDVTTGGNGYCGGAGAAQCGNPNTLGDGTLDCDYPASGSAPSAGDLACDAAPGYDGPTGVGTPVGLGAFTPVGPGGTISGAKSPRRDKGAIWDAKMRDPFPGGRLVRFAWNWGDGHSTVTTTATASHTYTATGRHTISVEVQDNYGQTGRATFRVSVG